MRFYKLMKDKNKTKNNDKKDMIVTYSKKKCIISAIIGMMAGLILAGGVGVVAVSLNASQIKYNPGNVDFQVDNAKDAMDELYKIVNNVSSNASNVVYGTFSTKAQTTEESTYVELGFKPDFIIYYLLETGTVGTYSANITNTVIYEPKIMGTDQFLHIYTGVNTAVQEVHHVGYMPFNTTYATAYRGALYSIDDNGFTVHRTYQGDEFNYIAGQY